jgi:hypothetical protein
LAQIKLRSWVMEYKLGSCGCLILDERLVRVLPARAA